MRRESWCHAGVWGGREGGEMKWCEQEIVKRRKERVSCDLVPPVERLMGDLEMISDPLPTLMNTLG